MSSPAGVRGSETTKGPFSVREWIQSYLITITHSDPHILSKEQMAAHLSWCPTFNMHLHNIIIIKSCASVKTEKATEYVKLWHNTEELQPYQHHTVVSCSSISIIIKEPRSLIISIFFMIKGIIILSITGVGNYVEGWRDERLLVPFCLDWCGLPECDSRFRQNV